MCRGTAQADPRDWTNQVAGSGFHVNTQNREEVRRFFNAIFQSGAEVRSGWSGGVANCEAGTLSDAYQEAVRTRINFFRAMAGVPGDIVFDPDLSAKAQAAALMVSANQRVSHAPAIDSICFSPEGYEGSANSNLALGSSGRDSIEAYMLDAGVNTRVGHRRWLIYPQTKTMGNGDIDPPDGSAEPRANANWNADDNFGLYRPQTREPFVAWPPAGYVPYRLVYPRWSFSIRGADFRNAVVTVTSNGVAVAAEIEPVEIGYGENSIVFVPERVAADARMFWPRPTDDVGYDVTIGNVGLGGGVTNYAYSVTVFDPEASKGGSGAISGPMHPEAGRTNIYRLPYVSGVSGYDFRYGKLGVLRSLQKDALGAPVTVSSVSSVYSLLQTKISMGTNAAFHLALPRPARPQWFMLQQTFVPSAGSELKFYSMLGVSMTTQVARAEVSIDSGASWQPLFEQIGGGKSETTFTSRAVSLAGYAGRAVNIRFSYGLTFGSAGYDGGTADYTGFYVDKIDVTAAAQFLQMGGATNQSNPAFGFQPASGEEYFVDGRARLYDSFGCDWVPGLRVTGTPGPDLGRRLQVTAIAQDHDGLKIDFTVLNGNPEAIYQLENQAAIGAGWILQPRARLETVIPLLQYRFTAPFVAKGTGLYRVTQD